MIVHILLFSFTESWKSLEILHWEWIGLLVEILFTSILNPTTFWYNFLVFSTIISYHLVDGCLAFVKWSNMKQISEHGEVKITDFGFSGFITELWDNIHCGTYNYAVLLLCSFRSKQSLSILIIESCFFLSTHLQAPELLTKSMKPTEKTDVYSYGMCLWEIFTNPHKYPWQNEIPLQDKGGVQWKICCLYNVCTQSRINKSFTEFIKRVVHERARPKLSEDLPQKLRKLIEECWDHDPEKRYYYLFWKCSFCFSSLQFDHVSFTDLRSNRLLKNSTRSHWRVSTLRVNLVLGNDELCVNSIYCYVW